LKLSFFWGFIFIFVEVEQLHSLRMLQCVTRSDQIILESFIEIFFNENTFTFRKDLSHPQVARGQPDDRGFVQLRRDGRRKRKEFSEFEKFGVFFLATIARSIFALVFHSKQKRSVKIELKSKFS